jgi:divalent metal cation (Fe/Co/Zn/Cd) transporter
MGYIEAVQRGKDPTLFVVLFEDSAAMLGLIVAFLGIFLGQVTGNPYFDGAASVIIGLILGGTAIWLAYETKGLLIGESANIRVVEGIKQIITPIEHVEHLNEVLTMHMGPEFILVNISIDFSDQTTATDMEKIIARIDLQIKTDFPTVKRIFIEAEARKACL